MSAKTTTPTYASYEKSKDPKSLKSDYGYDLTEAYQNEGIMCSDLQAHAEIPADPSKKSKKFPSESILHKNMRLATTMPANIAIAETQEALKKASLSNASLCRSQQPTAAGQAALEKWLKETEEYMQQSQKAIAAREVKLTDALFANYLVAPADADHLEKYGPTSTHTPLPGRVNSELRAEIVKATEEAQKTVFSRYINDEDKLKLFLKQYRDIQSHKACNSNDVRECARALSNADKTKNSVPFTTISPMKTSKRVSLGEIVNTRNVSGSSDKSGSRNVSGSSAKGISGPSRINGAN